MLVSPSSSSLSASSTSSGMHDHRVVPVEQIIIFAVRIGSVIQSWNFIPYLEGIVVGIKGSIHHKKWGSSAIWSLHVCALVGLSSCFVRGSEGTAPPSVSYPLSFRSRRSEGTRTGTQILSMMRGSGMMRGNSRLSLLRDVASSGAGRWKLRENHLPLDAVTFQFGIVRDARDATLLE